jgi:hypothetical protein
LFFTAALGIVRASEQIQYCHAHGDSVSDLIENQGATAISYFGRYFNTAVHRAWMHDNRFGRGALQMFRM